MSLLLQALQKAAKNRDDNTEKAAVDNNDDADLTLEPLAEPQLGEEAGLSDRQSETTPSPDDAAGVMRANELPSYSALDWARDHYMLTFVASAALFAIFYGLYVYLQVSNPGLFRSAPPPVTTPMQTAAAPPPPLPANDPPRISGLPAASQANALETDGQQAQPNAVGGATATTSVAPTSKPAPARVNRQTAPPVRSAAARPASPRRVTATTDSEGVEVIEIPTGPSVAALPGKNSAMGTEDIAVQRQEPASSQIDPVLMMAYEALKLGDYERANALYNQVLSSAPDNIDAMLGLAAIAWKQGRPNVASMYYGRVLELNPRNTHAQAGLIAILGSANPTAAETKLKQLIVREPSGFLYFTLGNLYGEQGLWSQAQYAYFQAYQFQPDNSDYAFNLAVGLEHVGQTRLALDYYRKALDLSFRKGRANFDQQLAIERVGQLSARVE